MKKAYCDDCAYLSYLSIKNTGDCKASGNLKDTPWGKGGGYIKKPSELNKNNDCKFYENYEEKIRKSWSWWKPRWWGSWGEMF